MTQLHLNLGTVDNDGTGDNLKAAGTKIEANFTDLYTNKAGLDSPAFINNPTAPTQSPGTNNTRLATTAYADAAVALAVTGILVFKGSQDCSANPNYPAANKGDCYVVTVAGKIGGASGISVDIGDMFVANANNAGGTQAGVGTSWFVLEHNLVGALLSANNLSDLASASTARTNLGLGSLATQSGTFSGTSSGTNTGDQVEAANSDVWTGTSSSLWMTARRILTAAVPTVLTDAATVTPDFNTGFNFEWTIGGNRTLANPTNTKSGQSGTIKIVQDGTGTRVVTYGNNWRFPGGSATNGVLSTAANAIDLIAYTVGSDGKIYATLSKAFAA